MDSHVLRSVSLSDVRSPEREMKPDNHEYVMVEGQKVRLKRCSSFQTNDPSESEYHTGIAAYSTSLNEIECLKLQLHDSESVIRKQQMEIEFQSGKILALESLLRSLHIDEETIQKAGLKSPLFPSKPTTKKQLKLSIRAESEHNTHSPVSQSSYYMNTEAPSVPTYSSTSSFASIDFITPKSMDSKFFSSTTDPSMNNNGSPDTVSTTNTAHTINSAELNINETFTATFPGINTTTPTNNFNTTLPLPSSSPKETRLSFSSTDNSRQFKSLLSSSRSKLSKVKAVVKQRRDINHAMDDSLPNTNNSDHNSDNNNLENPNSENISSLRTSTPSNNSINNNNHHTNKKNVSMSSSSLTLPNNYKFTWKKDQQPPILFVAFDNPQLSKTISATFNTPSNQKMHVLLESHENKERANFLFGEIIFCGNFEEIEHANLLELRGSDCLVIGNMSMVQGSLKAFTTRTSSVNEIMEINFKQCSMHPCQMIQTTQDILDFFHPCKGRVDVILDPYHTDYIWYPYYEGKRKMAPQFRSKGIGYIRLGDDMSNYGTAFLSIDAGQHYLDFGATNIVDKTSMSVTNTPISSSNASNLMNSMDKKSSLTSSIRNLVNSSRKQGIPEASSQSLSSTTTTGHISSSQYQTIFTTMKEYITNTINTMNTTYKWNDRILQLDQLLQYYSTFSNYLLIENKSKYTLIYDYQSQFIDFFYFFASFINKQQNINVKMKCLQVLDWFIEAKDMELLDIQDMNKVKSDNNIENNPIWQSNAWKLLCQELFQCLRASNKQLQEKVFHILLQYYTLHLLSWNTLSYILSDILLNHNTASSSVNNNNNSAGASSTSTHSAKSAVNPASTANTTANNTTNNATNPTTTTNNSNNNYVQKLTTKLSMKITISNMHKILSWFQHIYIYHKQQLLTNVKHCNLEALDCFSLLDKEKDIFHLFQSYFLLLQHREENIRELSLQTLSKYCFLLVLWHIFQSYSHLSTNKLDQQHTEQKESTSKPSLIEYLQSLDKNLFSLSSLTSLSQSLQGKNTNNTNNTCIIYELIQCLHKLSNKYYEKMMGIVMNDWQLFLHDFIPLYESMLVNNKPTIITPREPLTRTMSRQRSQRSLLLPTSSTTNTTMNPSGPSTPRNNLNLSHTITKQNQNDNNEHLSTSYYEVKLLLKQIPTNDMEWNHVINVINTSKHTLNTFYYMKEELSLTIGSFLRLILPFDEDTSSSDQSSIHSSKREHWPEQLSAYHEQLTQLRQEFIQIRKLIRIKLADEADFEQMKIALTTLQQFVIQIEKIVPSSSPSSITSVKSDEESMIKNNINNNQITSLLASFE